MISNLLLCFVFVNIIHASVIRNDVIEAIPILGTFYNNSAGVSPSTEVQKNVAAEIYNLTMQIPNAVIFHSNSSQHLVNNTLLNQIKDIADDNVILLTPGDVNFKDTRLNINIPAKIEDLMDLANAVPQFREKIDGSPSLENTPDIIEQKFKLQNSANENKILPSNIRKREAKWMELNPRVSYPQMLHYFPKIFFNGNPTNDTLSMVHLPLHPTNDQMLHETPRFSEFVYGKPNHIVKLPHKQHRVPYRLPFRLRFHRRLRPHRLPLIPRLPFLQLLPFWKTVSNPQFIQSLALLNPVQYHQAIQPSSVSYNQFPVLSRMPVMLHESYSANPQPSIPAMKLSDQNYSLGDYNAVTDILNGGNS